MTYVPPDIAKRVFDANVARIKDDLNGWIEQNFNQRGRGALKIALLEVAIEHQFSVCNETQARAVVEGVFKKVIGKKRGPMMPQTNRHALAIFEYQSPRRDRGFPATGRFYDKVAIISKSPGFGCMSPNKAVCVRLLGLFRRTITR
jgi:hypothetical protein